MNYIEKVEEFHKLFDAPVLDNPKIPNKERCDLRVNLLQEELNELKEAIDKQDLTEIADALCDLQYVLSGAVLEFGFKKDFDRLFEEVHRSNMSKACDSYHIAESTRTYYEYYEGTPCHIVSKEDKYLVLRDSDNKVLKSLNYSPAKLKFDAGK